MTEQNTSRKTIVRKTVNILLAIVLLIMIIFIGSAPYLYKNLYYLLFICIAVCGLILGVRISLPYRRKYMVSFGCIYLVLCIYILSGPLWYIIPRRMPTPKLTYRITVNKDTLTYLTEGDSLSIENAVWAIENVASLWCKKASSSNDTTADVIINLTIRTECHGDYYVTALPGGLRAHDPKFYLNYSFAKGVVEIRISGSDKSLTGTFADTEDYSDERLTYSALQYPFYDLRHIVRVLFGSTLGSEPLMAAFLGNAAEDEKYNSYGNIYAMARAMEAIGGEKEMAFLKKAERYPVFFYEDITLTKIHQYNNKTFEPLDNYNGWE
jgi:hypothetical protein